MKTEHLENFMSRFRYLNYAAQLISGNFYESSLKDRVIADIERLINQYETWSSGIFEDLHNEIEKNFRKKHKDRKIYLTQILRKLNQIAPYLNITCDREFCVMQGKNIFKIGNQEYTHEHNIVFETLLKYRAWEKQYLDELSDTIPVKYVILCYQYYRLFFKQLDTICQDYGLEIMQIQKDKGLFIWERENVSLATIAHITTFITHPDNICKDSVVTISPTKQIIAEEINAVDASQGWKYAFNKEDDYNLFVDLLTSFFDTKSFQIPQDVIKLKKNCKTRFALVFQPIHKKLSDKVLISDKEFFNLMRVLSHFNELTDNQIYKCIIR